MHDDEKRLLAALRSGKKPTGISADRAAAITRKFSRLDWVDENGQITDRGRKVKVPSLPEVKEATEDADVQRPQREGMDT